MCRFFHYNIVIIIPIFYFYLPLLGSQLRYWLFYSIPVLHGVLPDVYFAHYTLLVAAIHIRSSHHISTEALEKAERFLDAFYHLSVLLYSKLYVIVCNCLWLLAD